MRSRKARNVLPILILAVTVPLMAQSGGGPPAGNPGQGRPGIDFDEDQSPLQKEIDKAVKAKKDKEEKDNPACKKAMDDNDQAMIARVCKFPSVSMQKLTGPRCPDCGDLTNPNGKVIGKKIRTETILEFRDPGQKVEGKVKWDRTVIGKGKIGEIGNGAFNRDRAGNMGHNGARMREAVLFPDSANNDDRDCIDRVTGVRFGGLVDDGDPATPDVPIADGQAASCFDASGVLKRTLTPAADGCVHQDGTLLRGDPTDGADDDCYEEDGTLKTSLEELIDEDGPEDLDNDMDGLLGEDPPGDLDGDGNPNDDNDCIAIDGSVLRGPACFDASGAILPDLAELVDEDGPDAIDQDDDGRADEDPAAADQSGDCRNFGMSQGLKAGLGDVMPDGSCDLTRAIVVAANKKAMDDPAIGQKIFQADDDGNPDLSVAMTHPNAVEIGKEERRIKIVETFSLTCKEGTILAGDQCVDPAGPATPVAPGALATDAGGYGAISEEELRALSNGNQATIKRFMMMGFTFAPPVPEWGYRIEEEACVDLGFSRICVEVFFARIGYEFDVRLGLRLPVEVEISGIPDPSIPAGSPMTLTTTVQPLDFSQQQYKDYCVANRLDDERFISDCDRFSFPEFIDSFNPLTPADQKDGSEFVAAYDIFAGVIVRVLMVPVIRWGIDSSLDLATACTMYNIKNGGFNLLNLGLDIIEDGNIKQALKNSGANCASFTTPFGEEPDPLNPGVTNLRAFPLSGSINVRADCLEALARGEVVTIKGKVRPICTGMILGTSGASLGIGLGLEATAGSKLIRADWSATGDVDPTADDVDAEVHYEQSKDEGPTAVKTIGPITMDNYDDRPFADGAVLTLDEFTYFLNAIQLAFKANFQFGGILSPIPDLASFTLFNLKFSTGTFGPQFGQHAGADDITIPVLVENRALEVDASPLSLDPVERVDDHTLRITPGEFGEFAVAVRNLGTFDGGFDNFGFELSNAPNQSSPFTFVINGNTDFDCTDAAGVHFVGNPYNSIADDCYAADGTPRADRIELIDEDPIGPAGGTEAQRDEDGDGVADEDPVDDWATSPQAPAFAAQQILSVPAYSTSTPPPGQSLVLAISPFKHPLTRPGRYPFRITGDSIEAKLLGLAPQDPSGHMRVGASDVAFIEVTSFFSPEITIDPPSGDVLPGIAQGYRIEGSNGANVQDSMLLNTMFVDFNAAGCNLTTLGRLPAGGGPDCPYRAYPTVIQDAAWTTIGGVPVQIGPLDPLQTVTSQFEIVVPRDWAGMEDTTYQYITTVVSLGDPGAPPATNFVVVEQTVRATLESMTRYIGLEIEALIAEIENANAMGVQSGGLLPMMMHPVRLTNQRVLDSVLGGDLGGAARIHTSNIRIIDGFLHALDGGESSLPQAFADDWRARAGAIRDDLLIAEASLIPSAP